MDRDDLLKWAPAVLLVLLGMFFIWLKPNQGAVVFTNANWNTISEGEVRICDTRYKFSNLATGRSLTIYFIVACEGEYNVKVTFPNGQTFEKSVGHFAKRQDTWGNALHVTTTGIEYSKK